MPVQLYIIYPYDPIGIKIGGAETFIKGFIKYAPEDFDINFIGITSNVEERPVNRWMKLYLGSKKFNFYPLLFERDENKKTTIPLSLRFTLALKLANIKVEKGVLFFNRIEPMILFRKIKLPKIAIIHSDIEKQVGESEVLWSKFPYMYFLYESFILKNLDYLYTVSKNSLKFYQSRYPQKKEKLSFLPTWVDVEIFYSKNGSKALMRKKLQRVSKTLPIDGKWILFVGRLQKAKEPMRLVDSFFEYHKKNKESYLIIIGEGNLRRKIEAYVEKLKIQKNIFFLGNMPQRVLADFYRASNVLLLTSNFEGMPMCVLEALGSGVPVVTTEVGEVKRIVRNGFSGEVVKSFSPLIIAQALLKVLHDSVIYSKSNCVESVSVYTPQKALVPVYERIRELYKKKYS